MNRNKRRTHQPQNKQCNTCRHKEANCDSIAFERMPVIKKITTGVTLVDCACFQPATPPQAALSENPLIIAFRVILAGVRNFGTPVLFHIEGAPSEASFQIDQAIRLADTQLPLHVDYQLISIVGGRMLTIRPVTKSPLSGRKCIAFCLHALQDQAVTAKEPRIHEPASALARCTSTLSINTEDPRHPVSEIKALAEALNIQDLYRFGERSLAHVDDIAQPAAAPSPKAEACGKLLEAIAPRTEESAAPADPYAHLKAAQAAGKKVQFLCDANVWVDENPIAPGWQYNFPPERYRVAPETAPNLDVGTHTHTHPRVPATLSPTTTSEVDAKAWLADRAARAAAPAQKKDAAPFTSQPEVQALALIVATILGKGEKRIFHTEGRENQQRAVCALLAIQPHCQDFVAHEKYTYQDNGAGYISSTFSTTLPNPPKDSTAAVADTLAKFIAHYPHSQLSLSAPEVAALVVLRDTLRARKRFSQREADMPTIRASAEWIKALGIADLILMMEVGDMGNTSPDLLKPIKVTITPTEDEQRAQAHRAIADALTNPGADIKLPGHDVILDAVLAKMVNDILRQTQTKGYTFHTAEGAFVRCGE